MKHIASKLCKKLPLLLIVPFFFLSASAAIAKTIHVIKKGDSLAQIARTYKVSLQEIQIENKVNDRKLMPGNRLIIPSGSTTTTRTAKSNTQQKNNSSEKKPSKDEQQNSTISQPQKITQENIYHTVKNGDSLSSISRKYSKSISELKELNGLNSYNLQPGRKLLVKQAGPRSYTVKKGDTVLKIARRFNMDPDDLIEINELDSPALKAGQKLFLEEQVESALADNSNELITKTIEQDIQKISESEEFLEHDSPNKLIIFAKKLLNIPYKFGGSSILGIDCSAYVMKVYGLLGIELPRTAREQFVKGEDIPKNDLSTGDLVFFRTYAPFPSHVGIYLGNNLFIHASSKGKKVKIDNLDAPYYLKRFIGAKRLLNEANAELDKRS